MIQTMVHDLVVAEGKEASRSNNEQVSTSNNHQIPKKKKYRNLSLKMDKRKNEWDSEASDEDIHNIDKRDTAMPEDQGRVVIDFEKATQVPSNTDQGFLSPRPEQKLQYLTYQQFNQKLDNENNKKLFLKITVLEMQLNLQKAEEYMQRENINYNLPREKLLEDLIDYLLIQQLQEKSLKKVIKSSKKKDLFFSKDPQPTLADVNLVYSQNITQEQERGTSPNIQISSCNICLNDTLHSQMMKVSFKCNHEFCGGCLEQYLLQKIKEGDTLNISCPQQGCPIFISDQKIKTLISKGSLTKFIIQKKIQILNNDPQIRFCPKINCGNYVRFSPGEEIAACSSCNTKICFNCYMPSHKEMSCQKVMETRLEELLHRVRSGKCPSCKGNIMKIQVENAVRCPSCNHDFCWLCQKQFSKSHYSFWNICCGCPNMLEATGAPTFKNKFKYFRKGVWRSFKIGLLSLLLMIPYLLSLIFLPIFLPSGMYYHFRYKEHTKKEFSEQFLIGVILIFIGIFGYFFWLVLCIFPGIILAFLKFIDFATEYFEQKELK